jgi:hypothetical protein
MLTRTRNNINRISQRYSTEAIEPYTETRYVSITDHSSHAGWPSDATELVSDGNPQIVTLLAQQTQIRTSHHLN